MERFRMVVKLPNPRREYHIPKTRLVLAEVLYGQVL